MTPPRLQRRILDRGLANRRRAQCRSQPFRPLRSQTRQRALRRHVHDLRGPLTSLQLVIETLQEEGGDHRTAPLLNQMLFDVERLSARLEALSLTVRTICGAPDRPP